MKYLDKLKSDFVVNYMSSWMETENHLCIQMEFCEYDLKGIITLKNNFDYSLNAINYFISCEIFREILECVQFLHSLKPPIIHRDLKPANILLNIEEKNGRFVKICDFGLAVAHKISSTEKSINKSMEHSKGVGTYRYMAPEIVSGLRYNTKADIYSIGMIAQNLFEQINGSVIQLKKYIKFG